MGELIDSPISTTPVDDAFPSTSKITPASFANQAESILTATRAAYKENPLGGDFATAMARILTVDPDDDQREFYERQGKDAGHEVVGVATIREATPLLHAGDFDLVITSKHDGNWPKVHALAEEIGARTVLISGEAGPTLFGGYAEEGAARRGITYLSKGDSTLYSKLTALFDSLNEPTQDNSSEGTNAEILLSSCIDRLSETEAKAGLTTIANAQPIIDGLHSLALHMVTNPAHHLALGTYQPAISRIHAAVIKEATGGSVENEDITTILIPSEFRIRVLGLIADPEYEPLSVDPDRLEADTASVTYHKTRFNGLYLRERTPVPVSTKYTDHSSIWLKVVGEAYAEKEIALPEFIRAS